MYSYRTLVNPLNIYFGVIGNRGREVTLTKRERNHREMMTRYEDGLPPLDDPFISTCARFPPLPINHFSGIINTAHP